MSKNNMRRALALLLAAAFAVGLTGCRQATKANKEQAPKKDVLSAEEIVRRWFSEIELDQPISKTRKIISKKPFFEESDESAETGIKRGREMFFTSKQHFKKYSWDELIIAQTEKNVPSLMFNHYDGQIKGVFVRSYAGKNAIDQEYRIAEPKEQELAQEQELKFQKHDTESKFYKTFNKMAKGLTDTWNAGNQMSAEAFQSNYGQSSYTREYPDSDKIELIYFPGAERLKTEDEFQAYLSKPRRVATKVVVRPEFGAYIAIYSFEYSRLRDEKGGYIVKIFKREILQKDNELRIRKEALNQMDSDSSN